MKCNFVLTCIIIIYCLKSEYVNTTTVLNNIYVLNARNGHNSHRNSVYVIARLHVTKEKITPCDLCYAPMSHKLNLEALDRTLREITDTDQPFGGKMMLLAPTNNQII